MSLILLIVLFVKALTWQACFKKTRVELELLTDIDVIND